MPGQGPFTSVTPCGTVCGSTTAMAPIGVQSPDMTNGVGTQVRAFIGFDERLALINEVIKPGFAASTAACGAPFRISSSAAPSSSLVTVTVRWWRSSARRGMA